MKIGLVEHGGLAALAGPAKVLDTAALSGTEAEELKRLVDAAAAAAPKGVGTGKAYDGTSYTVTVDDGAAPRVLKQSDAAMSPEFAAMLDWIKKRV